MRAAVVGIGSNSVRALMADNADGNFVRLYRDREGTRLFAGLNGENRLNPESILRAATAAGLMVKKAWINGAESVDIFATSAARDAVNGQDFLSEVQRISGLTPDILSGEEEARLSYIGASRVLQAPGRCGVVDIGGGSTEIVTGNGQEIDCAFSCQMGAARLFASIPLAKKEDMAAVEAAAGRILREQLRQHGEFRCPASWAGTGGTFTTLAAMIRGISWEDRTYMNGTEIRREEIRQIGEKLADLPIPDRKQLPGLQPSRTDIVVHGVCILLAVMDVLGLPAITVSEWGNLDGYLWLKLMKSEEPNE